MSSKHLSVGSHAVPFGWFSIAQSPLIAQSPVWQTGTPVVQSLGAAHSQLPALHVPAVSQQPLTPQVPPVSGFDSHTPVEGMQVGALWHSS